MVVIIGVAHLSGGGLEISVQRPQHDAHASRTYQSVEQAKTTLLNLGILEADLEETLKLLPQLGPSERLKFSPINVAHHDLVAEGFKLRVGKTLQA